MAKSYRKMLVLAKKESVKDNDPIPTAGANAILCRGINPQPVNAEFVDRGLMRPYFGNTQTLAAGVHSRLEFEVEIQGSGSAGTAPGWGVLLEGCAFEEVIPTAGTEVQYRPISENLDSLTLYVYLDGLLYKMTGCYGNVAFDLTSRAVPIMRFQFIGTQHDGTDTSLPTGVDYSAFLTPKTVSRANTPTFSLHGVSNCVQTVNWDMQNQLVWRDLIGCGGSHISNRTPNGQISMEMTPIATKDWMTLVKEGTEGALNLVHGTVAGRIVEFDAPKVQLTNPQFADQDGILMLNAGLSLNPDFGNDEVVVTAR